VKLGLMPYIKRTLSGEIVSFPEYEYDGIDTLRTLGINKPVSGKCWVKSQGFSIKDEDGKVSHAVFFSEDISFQKNAEKELRIYNLFTDNLIQSANIMQRLKPRQKLMKR